MKKPIQIILFCIFIISSTVMAQTGPTGVWQSDLDTGTGEKLNLQFVINKLADGAYGITVHYMNRGIVKNLSATSVSFEDGKLAFNVEDLGGSFSGTLDNKTITGEWRQGDRAFPMVISPFKRRQPAGGDMDRLLGEWVSVGPNADGFVTAIICRFEKTADEELIGFVDFPDAGVFKSPIADIWIDKNQLRFRFPLIQAEITGELTSESIVGSMASPGEEAEVIELVKGKKYRPSVIKLDLHAEEMKKLLGRWVARLGPVTIIFRFEQNPGGESAVFVDVPEQNVKGMRIYKASFVDNTLFMEGLGVEYTGTLSGNTISGTMKAMGQPNPFPLVVTKE
jgi:hypothetical protein